jgi:hypothetical protein
MLEVMARLLVVIYGAPLTGKTTLARSLGAGLPGKTALVSMDHLLDAAILVPDSAFDDELDMVYTQQRLLVANYLKNQYNVVVEGPFHHLRDGRLFDHDADIDQLVALMRHLTSAALVLRLEGSPETLGQRARAAGRETEIDAALRLSGAYKDRYGVRYHRLDTSGLDAAAVLQEARRLLAALYRS